MNWAAFASKIGQCDASRPGRYFSFAALLVAGILLIYPLIDKYNEYCFEADAQATIEHVVSFRLWSKTLRKKSLFAPRGYPPYLDGQFIIYAAATRITDALKMTGLVDSSVLPTEPSLAMYTIRRANACFRLLAAFGLFWLAIRITHSALFSFLAGVVMLLTTQFLDIDLLRVDHPVIAALTWLLCLSLACIRPHPERRALLIGMSLLSAALVTMKASCAVFLLLPATAILILLLKRRLHVRRLLVPGIVFVAAVAAFCFRYILFHKAVPNAFRIMTNDLKSWQNVLGASPRFYYNWDLFLPDGLWFLGIVAVSWLVLAVNAVRKHRADEISVLAWTLFFSLTGFGLLKYSRGGYHLALLYLVALVMAAGALRRWLNPHPSTGLLGVGFACCLLPTLYTQSVHYADLRHRAVMLADATRIVRTQPREWMQTHAKPGARVTIPIHSEWALPPIFDIGLNTGTRFLTIPYTDPPALEKYEPPDIDTIANETDFIVLNDFHPDKYPLVMRKLGMNDLAFRWEHFWEDLPTHFRVIDFSSPTDSYGIRLIRIVIVNPGGLKDPAALE